VTAAFSLTTVVGNPKRLSRTLTTAEALASVIGSAFGAEPPSASIDLAELYLDGIEPPHDGFEHAAARIHSSRVLIVGTPVYKASYTGLLKLFLDQLPPHALEGTLAVPVTIAASAEHRLLADLQLRPVLAELGASLPVPSLALRESELPDLEEHLRIWFEANAPALEASLALGRKPVGTAA